MAKFSDSFEVLLVQVIYQENTQFEEPHNHLTRPSPTCGQFNIQRLHKGGHIQTLLTSSPLSQIIAVTLRQLSLHRTFGQNLSFLTNSPKEL